MTYWVLIMSTLGGLFPALGEGDTVLAVVLASARLWGSFLLIRRGVKEAAAVNRIVTVAKVVPIAVFVVLALFQLDLEVFAGNWTGGPGAGPVFGQVRGTMLATVFVFLGVEGASVYSRHARRREDVGRATVLGFLSVFAVFASVTIVSYGILPREELAALRQPSMAGVLEAAVGTWGTVFVGAGLVISVLGAYLAWTLMAAEVLFAAVKDADMPRFLARVTAADVPVAALTLTTVLSQAVLLVTLFSADAFGFALNLTSALVLIPFLLAAGYGLKIALRPEPGERPGAGEKVVAGIAVVYTAFLLHAAGVEYTLVSFLLYAPATILFAMARRERGRKVFPPGEAVLFVIAVALAAAGAVALATGRISL